MTQNSHRGSVRNPRTLAEWFEYGRNCFHEPDGIRAIAALEKVTGIHPGYRHPDGDNPYFYLGKIHEVENHLSVAIIYYTRALAVDARDEESLIGRGTCYTMVRQHRAAIYDFEILLRFPSGRRKTPSKHLYWMIAENYRQLGDWGQVLFWGQLALDADPGQRQQHLYDAMLESVNR
jgi:tetratricopeptide (TPR) repeat protein